MRYDVDERFMPSLLLDVSMCVSSSAAAAAAVKVSKVQEALQLGELTSCSSRLFIYTSFAGKMREPNEFIIH